MNLGVFLAPLLCTLALPAMAQSPKPDPLAASFLQPPDTAKPLERWEFIGPGQFSSRLARAEIDPKWNFYRDVAVLAVPAGDPVARGAIVDLSAEMKPDGQLTWQAPAGKWTILRFGHTTTGEMNDKTS